MLGKIESLCALMGAEVELILDPTEYGGVVVWDRGFSPPVPVFVASSQLELEEWAADVIRGLRIFRRAGFLWVWRSPGDWRRLRDIGRRCRPWSCDWDQVAETRRLFAKVLRDER